MSIKDKITELISSNKELSKEDWRKILKLSKLYKDNVGLRKKIKKRLRPKVKGSYWSIMSKLNDIILTKEDYIEEWDHIIDTETISEIILDKVYDYSVLFGAIDKLISDTAFRTDFNKRFSITQMDLSHIMLMDLNFYNSGIVKQINNDYDLSYIGFNLKDLTTALKDIKGWNRSGKLYFTKYGIYYNKVRNDKIDLRAIIQPLKFELEEINVDSLEGMSYPIEINLYKSEFLRLMKIGLGKTEVFSEVSTFAFRDNKFIIIGEGNAGQVQVTYNLEDHEIIKYRDDYPDKVNYGIFANSYLLNIISLIEKTPLDFEATKICIKSQAPLKISYGSKSGFKGNFYLAPRVEEEDDLYDDDSDEYYTPSISSSPLIFTVDEKILGIEQLFSSYSFSNIFGKLKKIFEELQIQLIYDKKYSLILAGMDDSHISLLKIKFDMKLDVNDNEIGFYRNKFLRFMNEDSTLLNVDDIHKITNTTKDDDKRTEIFFSNQKGYVSMSDEDDDRLKIKQRFEFHDGGELLDTRDLLDDRFADHLKIEIDLYKFKAFLKKIKDSKVDEVLLFVSSDGGSIKARFEKWDDYEEISSPPINNTIVKGRQDFYYGLFAINRLELLYDLSTLLLKDNNVECEIHIPFMNEATLRIIIKNLDDIDIAYVIAPRVSEEDDWEDRFEPKNDEKENGLFKVKHLKKVAEEGDKKELMKPSPRDIFESKLQPMIDGLRQFEDREIVSYIKDIVFIERVLSHPESPFRLQRENKKLGLKEKAEIIESVKVDLIEQSNKVKDDIDLPSIIEDNMNSIEISGTDNYLKLVEKLIKKLTKITEDLIERSAELLTQKQKLI